MLNGRLARAANERFDVMLTIDKNMDGQTSLRGLSLAVIVVDSPSNTLEAVLRFVPSILRVLESPEPGTYTWIRSTTHGEDEDG